MEPYPADIVLPVLVIERSCYSHVSDEVIFQTFWKHSTPVFITFTRSDNHNVSLKVYILDTKVQRFIVPQATPVNKLGHEFRGPLQVTEDALNFSLT